MFLAALSAGIIALSAGISVHTHHELFYQIKNALTLVERQEPALESIETKKDCVEVSYLKNRLKIKRIVDASGNEYFQFTDQDGKTAGIIFDEAGQCYVFQDARFPFQFSVINTENFQGFKLTVGGYPWFFSNQMEGDASYYAYRNTNARPMKLKKEQQDNSFLGRHPGLASGRGYIWSKTLPLIKKYWLLGSGPDTFSIVFPNDDLVGRFNQGTLGSYTTKPHSMYLQTAVQTGVPSLVCLLLFFGWYLADSIKLYGKGNRAGYLPAMGTCLMVSVAAFLIMGLTNDSMVTVTPIFYVLIGTGMGINHAVRKN